MAFKIGKKGKLFDGKFVALWGTEFLDKGGNPQFWEWITKKDVVAVFPITEDDKAVLVKNYRVPLEKYVIETPAGLTDKEGETHEELTKRELLEETGYVADVFHALPAYPYKSGTSGNMAYAFIATGLRKVGHEAGDDTEDISVVEIPLEKLAKFYIDLPPDTLFSLEILAIYEIAKYLKIVK